MHMQKIRLLTKAQKNKDFIAFYAFSWTLSEIYYPMLSFLGYQKWMVNIILRLNKKSTLQKTSNLQMYYVKGKQIAQSPV